MSTLTRLNIHRFRRVAPETTLELAGGFNVVLGRNATGKTTLLNLAVAADAFDFSAFVNEPFDVSWERHGREGHSRTRVTNYVEALRDGRRNTYSTVDVTVEPAGMGKPYRIAIGRDSAELLVEGVSVTKIARSPSLPLAVESLLLAASLSEEERDDGVAAHPRVVPVGAVRLDESTKHLEDVLATTVGVMKSAQVVQSSTTLPTAILAEFMPIGMLDEPPLAKTFSFVDTPFLAEIASTLGFVGATLTFDLLDSRDGMLHYDKPRFLFTDENGDVVRHDILSYGQKRTLSALWYFASKVQLLACDELVNGLHHEWIAGALDRIQSRQALLTSQNPLLLDYLRFESSDEVRRSFISCERHEGQLVWRNFTQEEAEDFFAAYEVGIQRISDILVTRGLW